MIEVKGLTKVYGRVTAIEDVTFSADRGEIVGFLGPNGAGKTTTMRILTGFTPATGGEARIAGFNIREDPIEVKRRIGYLPENVPLYPEMITASFLAYVAEIKGLRGRAGRDEVGRVVERCGLEAMVKRPIGHLSRGFRQRVGLAQALIGNPPVLIFDEPTVGLDPKQIIQIREMIRDLAQEHTVLLSTHILAEVAMICQRVLIIHQGRIVAQDSMNRLVGGDSLSLRVEVENGADRVADILGGVSGVRAVRREGSEFVLDVDRRAGLESEVASRLVSAGVGLRRLDSSAPSLEDAFMAAIAAEPGEGG